METELEKKFEKKFGVGKTKVGLVVCAVLVVILTISNVLVYGNLQNQINALEMDNTSLNSHMNTLQTEKSSLLTQVISLETWLDGNKTQLQTAMNERNQLQTWLDGNITNYESQIGTLTSQIDSLEAQITSLQNEIVLLEDEIDWLYSLISEYDEATFFFYYVKPEEQKFGVYDLDDELYGLEWIHPYEEDVFDCSEMSAYLEWYLENEGWHAFIVVGDSPFGSGYHAWLLVETSVDHYMPVESTSIEVVWWGDPYFEDYWTYDYEFETILDALDYYPTEFDWWD